MTLNIPNMMRAFLVVTLLFATSTLLALAAEDDGAGSLEAAITIGNGPETAAGPASAWISLERGEKHWYAFTEGGDENDVEIRMAVEPADRLAFEVWTSEQLRAWQNGDDFDPVGAGTTNPNLNDDLYWTGNFVASNTYYVVVNSRNFGSATYHLSIEGNDVGFPTVTTEAETEAETETVEVIAREEAVIESVEVEVTVAEEAQFAEPANPTLAEEVSSTDSSTDGSGTDGSGPNEAVAELRGSQPGMALAPAGTVMEIAPGETHWYAFRDEGDGEAIQAVLNATPTVGIEFEVWTAEQLRLWAVGEEFDPVGAGTKNSGLDIEHYWSGSFTRSGDYYVIVRHSRLIDGAVTYSLSVTGSDISF